MSDSDNPGLFQAPEIEEVAMLFPAYEIHDLIACGGMGAVYQATQRSLDRVVAIKILPREFSEDEAFRTGFEAEAKAMAKLNHPNLIGVYDFGEAGGMLYIIMEYVAGNSLFHSANGSAVDPAVAIRIVSEVCAGLEHAHSNGILHRDIKPGNILLDANISPKIGDFGLARALESKIEEGEQIFGTPGYTAPEVLEPPFEFDQRADVFSVGIMLHELLTGKLPEDDSRPASQLCACNLRLDAVIRRATHPVPSSRYSSASELAAELDKIASSPARAILTGSSAAASGRPYSPPKKLRSASSGLGVPVFLLVLIAAVSYFYLNRETYFPAYFEPAKTETPSLPDLKVDPEQSSELTTPAPVAPPATPQEAVSDPEINAPEPEPVPEAEIEPEAISPKFDVPEFLVKARGIMADRIAPSIETYKAEIVDNTKSYERGLSRIIKKLEPASRSEAEALLEAEYEGWASRDSMLPPALSPDLANIPGTALLHQEHILKQEKFREKLLKEISVQSAVYVLGIQKQIERLADTSDQPAIDLLDEEIELTKNDEDHFRSLFLE